jgi:hypothetical protein
MVPLEIGDVNQILGIAELPILRAPARRVYNAAEIAKHLLAKLPAAGCRLESPERKKRGKPFPPVPRSLG